MRAANAREEGANSQYKYISSSFETSSPGVRTGLVIVNENGASVTSEIINNDSNTIQRPENAP